MSKRILITGASLVPSSVIEYLRNQGCEVVHYPRDNWTSDELQDALQGANGYIIGGYEEPTAQHFEQAHDLEVVAWPGTDYKAYVPGWRRGYELGIAFVNAPGVNANSVAEFTIALMLILTRKIGFRFQTLRDAEPFAGSGRDLLGKTLGVIGMGRIGTKVSEIARNGFGMNIVYSSRTRHPEVESALGAQWLPKQALLAAADIVTLHRPGLAQGEAPEIGQRELEAMKPGSMLVNTVKWNLVALDSLFDALSRGNIQAAAFDGIGEGVEWEHLTSLPWDKFVYFPSTAFNTDDANDHASMAVAQAVVKVLNGGNSPYVNNPEFRAVRVSH